MGVFGKICKRYKTDGFAGGTKHIAKTAVAVIYPRYYKYSIKISNFFQKRLPIKKNYIVFECESDFADNPRSFYDYLLKSGHIEEFRIIWLVQKAEYCEEHFHNDRTVFINRLDKSRKNVIKLNYYLSISKLFIFSHPWWFSDWRKGQTVLNTTHSVSGIKAAGIKFKKKITDYVLACSEYCSGVKKSIFDLDDDHVLRIGMPRIDLMFDRSSCIDKLFPNYNGQKVIVSMSTFKQAQHWSDGSAADPYCLNVIRDVEALRRFDSFLKNNNCVMIVKIHHLQLLSFLNIVNLENIIYLTDDDLFNADVQTNTLLTNADILLTDYSSVFYDYLLIDRPIGFMLADFEEYTRGFFMEDPLSEMPGKKIYNYDELEEFITESLNGLDGFGEERKLIREKMFSYEDNKNSERLYNWVKEFIIK